MEHLKNSMSAAAEINLDLTLLNGMSWAGAQKSQLFSAAGKRSRLRCYRLANTFAGKYGLRRDCKTTNA